MLVLSLVVALLVAAVAFSMVMSIATVVERRTGANGTLVKDPETGEYRLRRDDD